MNGFVETKTRNPKSSAESGKGGSQVVHTICYTLIRPQKMSFRLSHSPNFTVFFISFLLGMLNDSIVFLY